MERLAHGSILHHLVLDHSIREHKPTQCSLGCSDYIGSHRLLLAPDVAAARDAAAAHHRGTSSRWHPAAEAKHQVQRRLLLDVVVRQRAAILKLLARKNQALLVRRDALLVLDLGLDVLDRVGALDLECDGLAGQCLDEDLHVRAVSVGVLWFR